MIKKDSNEFKSNRFFISLLILLLLIVYFKTFFYGLIFLDDDALIYSKFGGMNLAEKISSAFSSNYLDMHYYRPITLLSLIIDSLIGGQSFFIYHFTNFLLHLITCILLYLFIKDLGATNLIAILATLFFALNPLQINAVGWIAGRGDLLAAFFSVFALLIYLKFLKHNKPYLLIFVSVLLFLSFLSKEVSLLVPFLFLILYFIEKREYVINKNSISVLVMVTIVIGLYYVLRGTFLTTVHIDKFSFTTYYKNILVFPETISKFFIPVGIKALPSIENFTSISGALLIILLIILPIIFKPVKKARYYFGFLWFILLLLPGMVFRTMGQDGFYYWDCRSYLPAIGILFMITEIFNAISIQRHTPYYGVAAFYLLIFVSVTFLKIEIYKNPLTYWNSVIMDYPSSFLPYVGLFNYYNYQCQPEKAEDQLLQAINLRPEELSIRIKLCEFYERYNLSDKIVFLLQKTLIEDRLYSDYMAERYLDHILKTNGNNTNGFDDLINAYKDDKEKLEKINKIGRIRKSELDDSVL